MHHLSNHNLLIQSKTSFTCCYSHIPLKKELEITEKKSENNYLFNVKRESFCQKELCVRISIHFYPLCWTDAVIWRNIIFCETIFLIRKSEISFVLHVIQNVFFNGKYYLNGISHFSKNEVFH